MQIIENKNHYIVIRQINDYVLFSYTTKIATIKEDGTIIDRKHGDSYWKDYSKTTKKHYNMFIKTYGGDVKQ